MIKEKRQEMIDEMNMSQFRSIHNTGSRTSLHRSVGGNEGFGPPEKASSVHGSLKNDMYMPAGVVTGDHARSNSQSRFKETHDRGVSTMRTLGSYSSNLPKFVSISKHKTLRSSMYTVNANSTHSPFNQNQSPGAHPYKGSSSVISNSHVNSTVNMSSMI